MNPKEFDIPRGKVVFSLSAEKEGIRVKADYNCNGSMLMQAISKIDTLKAEMTNVLIQKAAEVAEK